RDAGDGEALGSGRLRGVHGLPHGRLRALGQGARGGETHARRRDRYRRERRHVGAGVARADGGARPLTLGPPAGYTTALRLTYKLPDMGTYRGLSMPALGFWVRGAGAAVLAA